MGMSVDKPVGVYVVGYWILDIGHWMMDIGYWILDVGCGRWEFLSAGKLSVVSIFDHRRVCNSVLPKRAYKIVVDGIESHSFHPEIQDDWLLIHQGTDPKRLSLMPFFRKRGEGKSSEQFIGF
jgi:hypothetical protein